MFRARLLSLLLLFALAILASCSASDPRSPGGPDKGVASTDEPTEPPRADSDEALAPDVSGIEPRRATAGSVGPSIVVVGEHFVPRSIVQLDGAPLSTTFVSATELRATIPTVRLREVASLRVTVGTSPPGGGASKEVLFDVENPAPELSRLTPLSAPMGAGTTSFTLKGSHFVSGSKAFFGPNELETALISDTTLDATIPANLLKASGSIPVRVQNPGPGGGRSSPIVFTVANPDAVIEATVPSEAFVGGSGFSLTVTGAGFVPGSVVNFNGVALSTAFESAGKLVADVPASSLSVAGDLPISVKNPPPGGGLSTPVVFHVLYPVPFASSVEPQAIPAGSPPTEVTIAGSDFFPASYISFDDEKAATTYVDGWHLKATLTAEQVAVAGTILARVTTPTPGGGTSSPVAISVTNGVPTIQLLSPSSVTAGASDTSVTIYGVGFVPTSVVRSNGQVVPASYARGGQLTATIPASHLVTPGNVAITVTNPPPGGGTSPVKNLVVAGCDTTGVDVQLGPVGTVTSLSTSFSTAPTLPRWNASGTCPNVPLDSLNLQPARFWIVQNTTGAPVTLAAYADCRASSATEDAFLALYRRSTVPSGDTQRRACANVVAEGSQGAGGYASPESGTSGWCPGLTKQNNGGITLAACEKAVVHLQPWRMGDPTLPAPKTLKVKAE